VAEPKIVKTQKRRQSPVPQRIYELKVTLREIYPPIWRQVHVRSDTTLAKLHEVLQFAMGWSNSHLHLFETEDERYGVPDPELDLHDERRVRLDRLLTRLGDRMVYEYDFGDSWEHDVVLERILEPQKGARYPRVIAGQRACPPEDCGGVPGYEEFLSIIADPRHPEHEEMVEWAGGPFDPEAFDVNQKNRMLHGGWYLPGPTG